MSFSDICFVLGWIFSVVLFVVYCIAEKELEKRQVELDIREAELYERERSLNERNKY